MTDTSANIQLIMNGQQLLNQKGKTIPFDIVPPDNVSIIKLVAKDDVGNETMAMIHPHRKVKQSGSLWLASNDIKQFADFTIAARKSPEIILYGWGQKNTIYKKTAYIEGEIFSVYPICVVSINKKIIFNKTAPLLFIS